MSTKEQGTSLRGAHSATAMVQTWTMRDPCARGGVAVYLRSLLLRRWDMFSTEQHGHDLPFTSASGLKRTIYSDAGWCVLLVPDVLIQHCWAPALVLFQEKGISPCLKWFPPAETVPRATWHSLEQLKQPIQTPKAVMSRHPHVYTVCAPILTWFFQVQHGSPAAEPVALPELQWLFRVTQRQLAERWVCSTPLHKFLWPISNVYVVQDHISYRN